MRVACCIVLAAAFASSAAKAEAYGDITEIAAVERPAYSPAYSLASAAFPATAIVSTGRRNSIAPAGHRGLPARSSALDAPHAVAGQASLSDLNAARIEADRRLVSLNPADIVYEQSQNQPAVAQAGLLDLSNGRLFQREQSRLPAKQHTRGPEDFMLMGFVAVMLIAYQLRKKHRFLRPHPFSY